jgi:hypothetical protein
VNRRYAGLPIRRDQHEMASGLPNYAPQPASQASLNQEHILQTSSIQNALAPVLQLDATGIG